MGFDLTNLFDPVMAALFAGYAAYTYLRERYLISKSLRRSLRQATSEIENANRVAEGWRETANQVATEYENRKKEQDKAIGEAYMRGLKAGRDAADAAGKLKRSIAGEGKAVLDSLINIEGPNANNKARPGRGARDHS